MCREEKTIASQDKNDIWWDVTVQMQNDDVDWGTPSVKNFPSPTRCLHDVVVGMPSNDSWTKFESLLYI